MRCRYGTACDSSAAEGKIVPAQIVCENKYNIGWPLGDTAILRINAPGPQDILIRPYGLTQGERNPHKPKPNALAIGVSQCCDQKQ